MKRNIRKCTIACIFIFFLLSMMACKTSKDPDKEEVKAACKSFFEAYANLDGDTAGQLIADNDTAIIFSEMQGAMAKHVAAKIQSAKVDQDHATVSVNVKAVDVEKVFKAIPSDLNSQEEALDFLISSFNNDAVDTKSFPVDVSMVRQEGTWLIEMTSDLSDALLGGYNSMIDSMLKEEN